MCSTHLPSSLPPRNEPGNRSTTQDQPRRLGVNFARDVVEAADSDRLALVALSAEGGRSEVTFGELSERSAGLSGSLTARGVSRGDVVMTVVGNTPEWVYALVACFRIGAVALPCAEQLRPADLRARMDLVEPRAAVAGPRGPRRSRPPASAARC